MDRPAHRIKRRRLTPPGAEEPILSPVQPPAVPSLAAAAAAGDGYPPWVILQPDGEREGEDEDDEDHPCLTPDAETATASHTSTGHPITVAFSLAAPPAPSRMWFRFSYDADSETRCNCSVIAAHGDSVLINIFYFSNASVHNHEDRFVYRASAAASDRSWARPPSLSMLPPPPVEYTPFQDATGILRRGEDDLVVAELTVEGKLRHDTLLGVVAKLLVFRSGEWGVKRAPINHGSGSGSSSSRGHDLPAPWPWETDMVVPVGDRLLCYVDLHHTTASSSSPTLSKGQTSCDRSSQAFVIRTWTLRIGDDVNGDDMAWEMDAMVDASELWSLDAYAGLPLVRPEYPVVNMDDPHLIRLAVTGGAPGGRKNLQFSSYFNSNHSSNNGGGGGGGALPSKIHVNIEPPPPPAAVATGEPRTSDTAEPKIVLVLERFSWRLKGYSIQDMAGGDDMLKAYTILSQDNGRCFRSLLGLPMSFNFELGLAVDDDQE
ncbi:hypothetical protein OsJ_26904 [Oryza sativa Japonica Group]|uniref:DUF1618 domain-containing protein n=1 Tax=Oryza sativa subsp. japonica TaxID=39947 RepID=A3BRZ1_ORYSJ|nr:hypothetical protein OsJ_26904 [Oryza sativa Japonica Group]